MKVADGRNVDLELGVLSGEAAPLVSRHPERARSLGEKTLAHIESKARASTTYYEQPILKEPVWKAYIPTYFFVGGLAGGALVIGAASQLAGGKEVRRMIAPARMLAAAGTVASAGLLIADLGRPSRFINMLRVFRPTSPMNMGTWILSGAGALSAASVVLPRRAANVAGLLGGLFGLGLSSYTAVLLANTAVPAWQHGARTLPPLFVASAGASAASALELVANPPTALRVFGGIAKAAELIAVEVYKRSMPAAVARHVRRGPLFKLSQALTVASLGASVVGLRRASGVLGLGGALALRFAVREAGRHSALDPRATFEPQRQ